MWSGEWQLDKVSDPELLCYMEVGFSTTLVRLRSKPLEGT